jgi:hypothetical protein
MKVFLSWSGDPSRMAASALRDWLPLVIQSIEPYMSAEDVEKGARWSMEIGAELATCSFGVICLTPENRDAPWIHFEAGALSKAIERTRVSPLLLGLRPSEMTGPVVQFQATTTGHDDVRQLVGSMNSACDSALDERRLDHLFETLWPELQKQLSNVEEASRKAPTNARRSSDDMLEELLELVRGQARVISAMEQDRVEAQKRLRMVEELRHGDRARRTTVRQVLGLPQNTPVAVGPGPRIRIVPRGFEVEPDRISTLTSMPEFQDFEVIIREDPSRQGI